MRKKAEDSCKNFSEPRERLVPNNAGCQRQSPKEDLIDSDFGQPALTVLQNRTVSPQAGQLIRTSRGLTSLHL